MKKIDINLTQREIAMLEHLSRLEDRPQAEIIRDAIAAYGAGRSDRKFAIDGIGEGPGNSVADLSDAEVLRGFGDDASR